MRVDHKLSAAVAQSVHWSVITAATNQHYVLEELFGDLCSQCYRFFTPESPTMSNSCHILPYLVIL